MASSKRMLAASMFLAAVLLSPVATASAANGGGAGIPPMTTFGDECPNHRIGELEPSIGFYQAIELVENSLLYSKQSKYQAIEVHQSKFFGKVLVLDGVIQLTERDADSYNEMMAHIPMFQHANPKRVLIIGGGDGYVLKEVRECLLCCERYLIHFCSSRVLTAKDTVCLLLIPPA